MNPSHVRTAALAPLLPSDRGRRLKKVNATAQSLRGKSRNYSAVLGRWRNHALAGHCLASSVISGRVF